MAKIVPATRFKAECLRLIDEMNADRQPVTITRRGHAVAVLVPADTPKPGQSLIGALRGPVFRYDQPFAPAVEPGTWDAGG